MAGEDISRWATNPRKHYAGVRMQQGRVIVDDDWNENERLHDEDKRRVRSEIVGPQGSSNDGFRIINPGPDANGDVEFDIASGSFYLAGMRLEIDEKEDGSFHTYRTQPNALQEPALGPAVPTEVTGVRYDLVYLEAWQQPVAAIEDEELFETALGGPDTSTRVRTMYRVKLRSDLSGENCDQAWKALKENLFSHADELDEVVELKPRITLSVGVSDNGKSDNPCAVNKKGGYLGGDNPTIRVQIVDETHFTWGFNNASMLYRVKLSKDEESGKLNQVELLTDYKDEYQRPKAGQIVEIIPRGALLCNGQTIAELTGQLLGVASVDPSDPSKLTLSEAVKENLDHSWAPPDESHYFMRVWNRGSDLESEPAIPYTDYKAVELGNTGLTVTLNGKGLPGDHWVIAVREGSEERQVSVVPWDLSVAQPPHGIRRFYAPLAIIEWRPEEGEPQVKDCRGRFDPLTKIRGGCCTAIVNPGEDIQKAIDSLPDEGGCVCLMTGTHEISKPITISRSNVVLRGETSQTRIVIHNRANALRIGSRNKKESKNIRIEAIDWYLREPPDIEKNEYPAVMISVNCAEVTINNCCLDIGNSNPMESGDGPGYSRSKVVILG